MSGRRLSIHEMNMVRHSDEVTNSMIKRGVYTPKENVRSQHVVCGCGAEGCVFVSYIPQERMEYYSKKALE